MTYLTALVHPDVASTHGIVGIRRLHSVKPEVVRLIAGVGHFYEYPRINIALDIDALPRHADIPSGTVVVPVGEDIDTTASTECRTYSLDAVRFPNPR